MTNRSKAQSDLEAQISRLQDEQRRLKRLETKCVRCGAPLMDESRAKMGDYYQGTSFAAMIGMSSQFGHFRRGMDWDALDYANEGEKEAARAEAERRDTIARQLEQKFWLCDPCSEAFVGFLNTDVKGKNP